MTREYYLAELAKATTEQDINDAARTASKDTELGTANLYDMAAITIVAYTKKAELTGIEQPIPAYIQFMANAEHFTTQEEFNKGLSTTVEKLDNIEDLMMLSILATKVGADKGFVPQELV